MKSRFKKWFSDLSVVGKITAMFLALVVLFGGVGAMANPCNDAVLYTNNTVTESVPFDTVSTKDPSLNAGETKIQKPGAQGVNKVTYKIGTKCNKQVSKDKINTVVKSKPTDQEQTVGNKKVTTETQIQAITFANQNVQDPTMDKGASKIIQAGVNGSKTVTFEVVKIDGVEQSRTAKSEKITLQPVNQITNVGTKAAYVAPAPAPSTSNCDPNYTPCIPYYSGNALNCPDIGKQVRVIGTDHNRFDADGDGWGCESY
jgi:uncharacterized protein YabE (DUF348 family)